MKRIDFERYLKSNGCIKFREGGNHTIWQNPKNAKQSSIPRHNEIVKVTCKIICKQLEIKSPF
ncbi:MAG: type II toxin-antitoxin system HicA family toxin [bacterium]